VQHPDPQWNHISPYYELLIATLKNCPDVPPFDLPTIRRFFSRTETSDFRERAAVTTALSTIYETKPDCRDDFLVAIEQCFVDLKEGILLPFAGPPLLTCLASAMELKCVDQEEAFFGVMTNGVLPLVAYRWLNGILPPLARVFQLFVTQHPAFAVRILHAVQKYWPCSTRAAASVRLVMSVVMAWDSESAARFMPAFFDFVASNIQSIDSGVVGAVLATLESGNAARLLEEHGTEAIQKLCKPIIKIQKHHWHSSLTERAKGVLQNLEKMNQPLFECTAVQSEVTDDGRENSVHLEKWKAVIALAKSRDRTVEDKVLLEKVTKCAHKNSEFDRVRRIVRGHELPRPGEPSRHGGRKANGPTATRLSLIGMAHHMGPAYRGRPIPKLVA
jgi:hypothetical protein